MPFDLATAINAIAAVQGATEAERQLLGEIEAFKRHTTRGTSQSGANETLHVVFADATAPDGYFKAHDGLDPITAHQYGHDRNTPPVHECAAWQLARRLGPPYDRIVTPTVYREVGGRTGSIAQHRDGSPNISVVLAQAPEQVAAAGFFDALIGQQDRHDLQHRWDGQRLSLIDHGFCFPTAKSRNRNTLFWDARLSSNPRLAETERAALEQIRDSNDLLGIAPMLDPARAETMAARVRRMLDRGEIEQPRRF